MDHFSVSYQLNKAMIEIQPRFLLVPVGSRLKYHTDIIPAFYGFRVRYLGVLRLLGANMDRKTGFKFKNDMAGKAHFCIMWRDVPVYHFPRKIRPLRLSPRKTGGGYL